MVYVVQIEKLKQITMGGFLKENAVMKYKLEVITGVKLVLEVSEG